MELFSKGKPAFKFEMLCRETFIFTKFQFSALKPAMRWLGCSCLHLVSQEMGQLVLEGFQSPGTAAEHRLERSSERSVTASGLPARLHLRGRWTLGPGSVVMQSPGQSSWRWNMLGNLIPRAALCAPQHAQPVTLELSPGARLPMGKLADGTRLPCFTKGRADIQGCQSHFLSLQGLSGDTGTPETAVAP